MKNKKKYNYEFINTKNSSDNKELNYVIEINKTNNVIKTKIDETNNVINDEDNEDIDINIDETNNVINDEDNEDNEDIDINIDDEDDEDDEDIDIDINIDEDDEDIDINIDEDELGNADDIFNHVKIDFSDFENVIHELLDKQSVKLNKNNKSNNENIDVLDTENNKNNKSNNENIDELDTENNKELNDKDTLYDFDLIPKMFLGNLDNFTISQSKQFNNLKVTNIQSAVIKFAELKSKITEIDSQCRDLIDEYLSNVNVVCFKTENNQRILCKKNDKKTNYYFDKVIISIYEEDK